MTPPVETASRCSTATASYVALLRGINVGGRNKLSMDALVKIFASAGCEDVRTHVQSGNVLFVASPKTARRIPSVVSDWIAASLRMRVPIVLRRPDELRAVAAGNPFLESGADPASLHVAFLAGVPDRSHVAALDPERSPGDSFELRGREIYLHLPNGEARTTLTNAYLDSTLATRSTIRNWRTLLELLEMAQEHEGSVV